MTAIEPAGVLRLQIQQTEPRVQPLASYAEAEAELRCGHGATSHPWGPLGRWQTSVELRRFLRWGHAEALPSP